MKDRCKETEQHFFPQKKRECSAVRNVDIVEDMMMEKKRESRMIEKENLEYLERWKRRRRQFLWLDNTVFWLHLIYCLRKYLSLLISYLFWGVIN